MPVLADADSTTFLISGGIMMTLSDLIDADLANFEVSGSSSLTVPKLTAYTGGATYVTSTLQASGTGSVLSFPELKSITANAGLVDGLVQVGPTSGGDVELPALTQVSGPTTFTVAPGSGTLNLSQLSTFTGGTLNYSGGGLEMPVLADADSTTFLISGGIMMTLSDLIHADLANFEVSAGSSLTVPILTAYTGGATYVTSTLQASGTGSVLSFPELKSITANAGLVDGSVQVGPTSGGDVELPALQQVSGPTTFTVAPSSRAQLNLSQLSTFTGGTLKYSGGGLEMPVLADADSTTFLISGGIKMTLSNLIHADLANFEVSAGSSLTVPILTAYTGGATRT